MVWARGLGCVSISISYGVVILPKELRNRPKAKAREEGTRSPGRPPPPFAAISQMHQGWPHPCVRSDGGVYYSSRLCPLPYCIQIKCNHIYIGFSAIRKRVQSLIADISSPPVSHPTLQLTDISCPLSTAIHRKLQRHLKGSS